MTGRLRAAGVATAVAALAGLVACDAGRPHALDRVDRSFAIGWDTTMWVGRRGQCYNAREGGRPPRGWSPGFGRYILTLIDSSVKPKVTVRGRMYLAHTGPADTSFVVGVRLPRDDRDRHPFVGATDFPFERLGLRLDDAAPGRDSFDPLRPGILLVHVNHDRPAADPDFALWIGTPATIRDGAMRDSMGGLVLAIRGGGGDGFWGVWGPRGAGTRRQGYFCAGHIDA